MLTEQEKLEALAGLGIELNQVKDLDILMQKILTLARRFVNADAGSIYIKDKDSLLFTYTRNDTLEKKLPKGDKLIYSTFSMPINKKSIAGFVAETKQPLNIEDVYNLEPTAPYSFNRHFDETSQYHTQSVLTTPLTNPRGDLSGVLQVINALDEDKNIVPFSPKDLTMMSHFASIAALALERAQMTRALLLRMIKMSEMRDPKETGAHVNRVGAFSLEIYERWAIKNNVPPKEVEKTRDVLRMAAMLHDVGKVAISDMILKKPGRFDKDEYETMKQHTVLGARLFINSQSDFDDAACLVALNHHERWDGKGYPGYVDIATGRPIVGRTSSGGSPRGKEKEDIPLFGRIVSLADVYDALSSKRAYKEAWDESHTLQALEQGTGTQFDPELVEIFFSSLDVMRSIQQRYKEEPES